MIKIKLKRGDYTTLFEMTIGNQGTIAFMRAMGLGEKTLRATVGQKADYVISLLANVKANVAKEDDGKQKTYLLEVIDRLERTCATFPDATLAFEEIDEAEEEVEDVEEETTDDEVVEDAKPEGIVKKVTKRIKKVIGA